MFSYSQQGFSPSYCAAYIAGSKAVEGSFQTVPGSVWWEKCSPRGQSRKHLYFHHQHNAPLERRMSNNACQEPASPSSLVVPHEYLCHSATEYFNGCTCFPTNQKHFIPTCSPEQNRSPPPTINRNSNAAELLMSQYRFFRLILVKLKNENLKL